MPYVQQSDIVADIPPDFLTQALDDNNDGVADAGLWDLIAQQVGDAIDGQIGVRYALPLPVNLASYPNTYGYPPVVVNAARVLALEKLYGRRTLPEGKNPWTARANMVRDALAKIGSGYQPLDPAENRKDPSISIITAPLRAATRHGGLAV